MYYSIIEIACEGGLPWRHVSDKALTCQMKKKFAYTDYHNKVDRDFGDLLTVLYLDMERSCYEDDINYAKYIKETQKILNKQESPPE